MPNHCINTLTIRFNTENQLYDFTNDYLENYEGAWDKKILKKGSRGVIVTHITGWEPDFQWLQSLLSTYSSCWIKNEWLEEGGYAGVWVGYYNVSGMKVVDEMKWVDLSIEEREFLF